MAEPANPVEDASAEPITTAAVRELLERFCAVEVVGVDALRAQACHVTLGPIEATTQPPCLVVGLDVDRTRVPGSGCARPYPVRLIEVGRPDGRPRTLGVAVGRADGYLRSLGCFGVDAVRSSLPASERCVAVVTPSGSDGSEPVAQVAFPSGGRLLAAGETWEYVEPVADGVIVGVDDDGGLTRRYALDGTLLVERHHRRITGDEACLEAWRAREVAWALHELPHGVLHGMNGASADESLWLRDLADSGVALSQELGWAAWVRFYEDARWHGEHYAHYLTRRRHFAGYRDYLVQRGGSVMLGEAMVLRSRTRALQGMSRDEISAQGRELARAAGLLR